MLLLTAFVCRGARGTCVFSILLGKLKLREDLVWQQWPRFATRRLTTVLEPDLDTENQLMPDLGAAQMRMSLIALSVTLLTCTSFSPRETRLTISFLAALSGLELRWYSASRIA